MLWKYLATVHVYITICVMMWLVFYRVLSWNYSSMLLFCLNTFSWTCCGQALNMSYMCIVVQQTTKISIKFQEVGYHTTYLNINQADSFKSWWLDISGVTTTTACSTAATSTSWLLFLLLLHDHSRHDPLLLPSFHESHPSLPDMVPGGYGTAIHSQTILVLAVHCTYISVYCSAKNAQKH